MSILYAQMAVKNIKNNQFNVSPTNLNDILSQQGSTLPSSGQIQEKMIKRKNPAIDNLSSIRGTKVQLSRGIIQRINNGGQKKIKKEIITEDELQSVIKPKAKEEDCIFVTIKTERESILVLVRDIIRLESQGFAGYYNDTLVDARLAMFRNSICPSEQRKHHIMSSLFLTRASSCKDLKYLHQEMKGWTKNVDLFDKQYIHFPLVFGLHWSYLILCSPMDWINKQKFEEGNQACLLHFDSADLHTSKSNDAKQFSQLIKIFISGEYTYRKIPVDQRQPTYNNSLLFENLPTVFPYHPMQNNGYDCGAYVTKFAERLLKSPPRTCKSDQTSRLFGQFSAHMFTPNDVTRERHVFKNSLASLKAQSISKQIINID